MGKTKLAWDARTTTRRQDGEYVRERSADPYHTARWTRLSKAFRNDHPLCAECLRQGRISPSTVTDHIIPYPICAENFFDIHNLQALCERCNHDKGERDKKAIAEWRKRHTATQ